MLLSIVLFCSPDTEILLLIRKRNQFRIIWHFLLSFLRNPIYLKTEKNNKQDKSKRKKKQKIESQ